MYKTIHVKYTQSLLKRVDRRNGKEREFRQKTFYLQLKLQIKTLEKEMTKTVW